ncbi:MAG TPA: DinB family protein [Pirellulaceae bacterium]|nr:DinB family protein [Pirellulaceae bacterium]
MTNSEILQELARQVRGDTIRILDTAEPEWLTYSPPGTANHILWHAGHALWLQDLLCERLLGAGGGLPSGWSEKFGMNCQSPSRTEDWPHREELRILLQAQLGRVLDQLAAASDNRLAEIADASRGPATISDRIIHGLHDEAKHCGEMYLILKLCRVQGV